MHENNSHKKYPIYVSAVALVIALLFVSLTSCRFGNGKDTDTNPPTGSTDTNNITTSDTEPVNTSGITEETETTKDTETEKNPETSNTPVVTSTPLTTPTTTEPKAPETTLPPVEAQTSGVFHAETGTSLGFRVEWELVGFEGDKAIINTKVILSTYQLYISARNNLGIIKFGDKEIRFSTDRITQDQNKKVEIILTEQQVKIDTDSGFAIVHFEVSWFFNATYAGTDYEWIGAGGYISINREG